MKDNIICHFICSALAGFTGAVVGSPVDVLKTRIINSNSKENLLKFVYKIIKNEVKYLLKLFIFKKIRDSEHFIKALLLELIELLHGIFQCL